MALLLATEIGLFRANPNANVKNNIKLVDPDTPGTTGTDTLAIDVADSGNERAIFEGVTYQGKDGVESQEKFFRITYPEAAKDYYTLPTTCTAAELRAAILNVIEQFEVDPKVTVTKASTTYTIVHKGAGTMDDLMTDGILVATTRT